MTTPRLDNPDISAPATNNDVNDQPPTDKTNQPADNPPATPPTPPATPFTGDTTLHQLLREQNRQIQELRKQQEERDRAEREAQEAAERARNKVTPEEFFKDPDAIITQRVEQGVKRAIEPLQQFVSAFQNTNTYDRLKSQFKAHPQYAQALAIPAVEQQVDYMMSNAQPTEQNMMAAIVSAVGAYNMGMLGNVTPATPTNTQPTPTNTPNYPTNQPPVNPMTNPAHLRPSNPAAPINPNQPRRRGLTELEKRLARENGMSEEQYLDWLELDSSQVGSAAIGQPPKK